MPCRTNTTAPPTVNDERLRLTGLSLGRHLDELGLTLERLADLRRSVREDEATNRAVCEAWSHAATAHAHLVSSRRALGQGHER